MGSLFAENLIDLPAAVATELPEPTEWQGLDDSAEAPPAPSPDRASAAA